MNIDEFNSLSGKIQKMSEEICTLKGKLERALDENVRLKKCKADLDKAIEEQKLIIEKKESRIMELTDLIAQTKQNVNVNVFAVITGQNMFPLAIEKFDRTFHGLPEDMQVATAGVVMKSLPTELPSDARLKVENLTEIKRHNGEPKVEMNFGADSNAEIYNH